MIWALCSLTRRNDLTRGYLNGQPPFVKVLDMKNATGKRGDQIDLGLVEEVIILPLETGVGLLLNFENDVTRLAVRELVTLAAEFDPGTALDAPVDVDVQNLPLDDSLLAVALLAAVLIADDLSLALAVGANGLETLDHGTHLAHHHLHTAAVAARALLDGALLTSATIALGADDGLLQRKLRNLAAVDILERHLVDVGDGASLLGPGLPHAAATTKHAAEAAAAAEKLCEEVLCGHTAAGATAIL